MEWQGSAGEKFVVSKLAPRDIPEGGPQAVRRRCSELLKEVRERLLHARGILDFDAWDFQSQNGEAHGHAMVVVGFDLGAMKLGGDNLEAVARLYHLGAALGQLGAQRNDALALLQSQASQVAECPRLVSQRSQ